jgi:Holliday junction resolvase RusA-like endonuclease
LNDLSAIPSMADAPFHCPPDIVLDLPVPPSVNRTRKIDYAWQNVSDQFIIAARGRSNSPLRLRKIMRFEAIVTLSEHHTKIDLDNSLKCLIDYLKRIEVIEDDGPKFMRRVTVEWGIAPMGCRVVVRPIA